MFGVKSSLVVEPSLLTDEDEVKRLGFKHGPVHLVERDFVLLTQDEGDQERHKMKQSRTEAT